MKLKVKTYDITGKVEEVKDLIAELNNLEHDNKTYDNDMKIADVIKKLESILQ